MLNFKKIVRFAGIVFLCILIASFVFFKKVSKFSSTPYDLAGQAIKFNIKPGQNLSVISDNLQNQGIIKSSFFFKILVSYKESAKELKAGEYMLSASKTPLQILFIITKGSVKLYKLTIPEGLNVKEIAQRVENAGFGTKENFILLADSKIFTKELGINQVNLEGYLYPETYFFPKNTSQKKIIKAMVKTFNKAYTPEFRKQTIDMGFSIHEIVTLASIIEKETGAAKERPVISSVFHNRLKKGMRLESDPTVIYGIKDFNGNITRKDLRTWTPYNTYKIKALPPGPIANPGGMSIKAALYPATTDYIFFVSKKDTTHKFSKTMKEHNKAVRKYQLNR
ncbi:MAG: endolytic transglycosylase MltG [Desulfobacteraceae bacterium]|nr:endolytic transglycosylase MltG [Desulfobacteraceae bacterium]